MRRTGLQVFFWLAIWPLTSVWGQIPGTLDLSFGDRGRARVHVGADDQVAALLGDAAGNIYLAGQVAEYLPVADLDFLLVKLDPSGRLDPDFGMGGYLRGDLAGFANSRIVAADLQDSAIVFLAEVNRGAPDTQSVVIGKLDLRGNFDPEFGNDGIFCADFVGTFNAGGDIRILGDGRLLFCGTTSDTSAWHLEMPLIGRLDAVGRRDSSFGTAGIRVWRQANGLTDARVQHNDGGRFQALLDLGDRYLFGGSFFTSVHATGMLMLCDSAGELVPEFGTAGVWFPDLNPGQSTVISDLVRHGDGIAIGAQVDEYFGDTDLYVLQMDLTGENVGVETFDLAGNHDGLRGMLGDEFGQLMVAGESRFPESTAPGYTSDLFVLTVVDEDLRLIADYGQQGHFWWGLEGEEAGATAIGRTPEGDVLLAGYRADTAAGNLFDVQVLRLHHGAVVARPESILVPRAAGYLYPNPASDRLWLRGGTARFADIYDLRGRKVMAQQPLGPGIWVAHLPAGMYVLEVAGRRYRWVKR
ncbi:MAG: T9SS type A sorting domain-containing protein [Bacteroidota bacterium]